MARPRSAASAGTRQRLSEAGLELFHTRGYNGTSVQDIVTAAGAPKGSFYNHFPSKEALALDSLARYCAAVHLETLGSPVGGTPLERITAHVRHLVVLAGERGDRGCLLGNLATEIPAHNEVLRQAVAKAFAGWISALAATIEEARAAGQLPPAEPAEDLASFIINSYLGAAARTKVTGSTEPMQQFVTATLNRTLT
ncbi:TetR/AcrR family transcriptional regulator [Micromonospora vulcania]|uniref:TetR/AcrR family transcriptional regulator n=1 Tax=Micromonospora vulcania TaxID=1441873 RepID=A0ABW1H4D3_9ACTN